MKRITIKQLVIDLDQLRRSPDKEQAYHDAIMKVINYVDSKKVYGIFREIKQRFDNQYYENAKRRLS